MTTKWMTAKPMTRQVVMTQHVVMTAELMTLRDDRFADECEVYDGDAD
jgi:hypothetical protein